jgi:hypothetical protein
MTGPVYGYPDVGRFGLAHSLLAWARCTVWCAQTGAGMLAANWFQPRIGPWLRGERDKRTYFMLFGDGGAVGGMRRVWLLATARRVEATALNETVPLDRSRPTVVRFFNTVYNDEPDYYEAIRGHSRLLHGALVSMTRPAYRVAPATSPFIAIHVRLGDFTRTTPGEEIAANARNIRLPIDWYADRLIEVRRCLGDLPAVLFSDGDDQELAPILKLDGVTRAEKRQSITDLLHMAESDLLISSGSGFSSWAAFLGEVPRICYPGQVIEPVHPDASLVVESAIGSSLPARFVERLNERSVRPAAPRTP